MCEDCPDGCPVETPKDSRNIVTNADRIRGMSDDELAELLSQIAYAMYTPWSEPFSRTCCDSCPVTTVKLEGYCHEIDLHECDFTDGKCPHGGDIVYWLRQPAKEE